MQGLISNCKLVRRDHVNGGRRCRYLLPEPSTNAYIDISTERFSEPWSSYSYPIRFDARIVTFLCKDEPISAKEV